MEGAVESSLLDALDDDLARLERDLGVVPADNGFEGRHTVRICLVRTGFASRTSEKSVRPKAARSNSTSSLGCWSMHLIGHIDKRLPSKVVLEGEPSHAGMVWDAGERSPQSFTADCACAATFPMGQHARIPTRPALASAAIGALDQIRRWPADRAAAVVVGLDGAVLDQEGPTDHRFELASVTKLLTAYAVLVAVEEETVGLDEAAGPPGSTVRHLLAHASGLGLEQGDGVLAEPGRRRIYSNAGFEVLGELVAGRAGMPFGDYLTDAVLAPLGMAATSLDGSPAHGAASTAAGVARLAGELLAPTLISRATVAEATTGAFPALAGVLPGFGRQDPNDWGLGFELRGHKRPHWTGATNAPATFGHFGQKGSFLWVDPAAGVALAVLTDRPFAPWATDAWPALSDAVLAERAARFP